MPGKFPAMVSSQGCANARHAWALELGGAKIKLRKYAVRITREDVESGISEFLAAGGKIEKLENSGAPCELAQMNRAEDFLKTDIF